MITIQVKTNGRWFDYNRYDRSNDEELLRMIGDVYNLGKSEEDIRVKEFSEPDSLENEIESIRDEVDNLAKTAIVLEEIVLGLKNQLANMYE